MPKFQVESSGANNQVEISAFSAGEAARKFLDRHYRLCLQEHDASSDPNGIYHGDRAATTPPWKYITISVSPPYWECANPKCDELLDKEGEFCGDCTFICERCERELDNSYEADDPDEYICKTCYAPLHQLARAAKGD